MTSESGKIAELLDSRKFRDAERLLNQSIRTSPQDRRLQSLAFRLYKATYRHSRALKVAKEMIDLHPDHWSGYAFAARILDAQKSSSEAIRALKPGLKRLPKNRRLLTLARRLYTKLEDQRKTLKSSVKLAELCPKKIGLQVEVIHKLVCLGKTNKAGKLLAKALSLSPDDHRLAQLEGKLNHFISTDQKKYGHQQFPPSICIAGNCQILPITEWLQESFPFSKLKCLETYHLIEHQSTIDSWLADAKNADIIFMIPVKEGFNGFNFGSEAVSRDRNQSSIFITYPSFHFEAFYPLFGYVKTSSGSTLRGKDIHHEGHTYDDYHDFLAIWLSQHSDDEINRSLDAMHLTETDQYEGSSVIHSIAVNSFLQFSKRYPGYIDILKNNIRAGMGHTFNHPSNQFLCRMYSKIWTQTLKCSPETFIPYTNDPLNHLQLPIPSFVTRSLTSARFEHPWIPVDHIQERTSLPKYLNNLKKNINFYRENQNIANNNIDHPKLKLAKEFMEELNS